MDAAAEGPLPPKPVAPSRKRCPHDYSRKDKCPMCNPCAGGHGKVKWNCGICAGNVQERNAASLIAEKQAQDGGAVLWPAAKGEKCTHIYTARDKTLRTYSHRSCCPICNNCGHGITLKANCKICNNCGHRKLKQHCNISNPCKHGNLKGHCLTCKSES